MRTRRYATMSLCLFDGDPLWRALRGTFRNSVPMDLLHLPVDRRLAPPADATLWPGFEHYLA